MLPFSSTLRWLPIASLAASVALLLFHLADLANGNWGRLGASALAQTWPILILLFLTYGLRGTSFLQVLGAAMASFFMAIWLARVGGGLVTDIMGQDAALRLTVVIPIIEEIAKLLPFLGTALFLRRREESLGVLDLGLLGLASGAGFAFHEDILWGRYSGTGFDGIGWLLPSIHTETGLVAGHTVWTALVGLAIGFSLGRRNPLWRLVPLATLVLVIVDHGTWNAPETRESLSWLTGGGWLAILLVLAGLVAAAAWDAHRVRHHSPDDRLLRREVFDFVTNSDGDGEYAGTSRIRRWLVGSSLLRLQARLAYRPQHPVREEAAVT